MKIFRRIVKTFHGFDQFAVQPQLLINKNQRFGTTLGTLCTLSILALIVNSTYELSLSLYNKSDPSVVSIQSFNASPQLYNLTSTDFFFAFIIMDDRRKALQSQDKIVRYSLQIQHLKMNPQKINLPLIKCSKLPKNKLIAAQTDLQETILTIGYCLDPEQLNKIGTLAILNATEDSNVFSRISFSISKCQGKKCYSKQKLSKSLEGKTVAILYSDYSIDQSQPADPFQRKISAKYFKISTSLKKTSKSYLRHTFISDVYNPFYFWTERTQYHRLQEGSRLDQIDAADIMLLDVHWQLDHESIEYVRTYSTVLDILGNMGGLYSFMIFIIGILLDPIVSNQFNLYLAHKLFDVAKYSSKQISPESLHKFKRSSSNKELKKALKQKISCFAQFLALFKKDPVVTKAIGKTEKMLDVTNLSVQFNQIKMLRNILLNDDQLQLFKHTRFRLDQEKDEEINEKHIQRLYQSYNNIQSKKDKDYLINDKLIGNLDPKVLQAIILLRSNDNSRRQLNGDLDFLDRKEFSTFEREESGQKVLPI